MISTRLSAHWYNWLLSDRVNTDNQFITRVRKIAKTDYWLRHVRLSVHLSVFAVGPHGRTRFPLGRVSWKLIFEYFLKIRRENWSLIKCWQYNDQLDAHLLYTTIRPLQFSTRFEHYTLIIRRLNCINAASGIVTLNNWLSVAQVERELLCSSLSTCATDIHLLRVTMPDAASIQFNLLMMSV